MKTSKRTIVIELKRVMSSWQIYVSFLVIVLSAIITYSRNLSVRNLSGLTSVGTLNTFIYSNVVANNIIILLAPAVAGLVYSTSIIDDMKTGMFKQFAMRIRPIQYVKLKIYSSIIMGGSIFLVSYIIIFLAILILDPSASVRTEFNRNSLFGIIYDRSMFLYCVAFIIYSFIFGAIYSLVSLGVAMVTCNKYMALGLPFFIYYTAIYGMNILPKGLSNILYYFLPTLTFDITQYVSLWHYVFQLSFALAVSMVLIIIGSKRLLKNGALL